MALKQEPAVVLKHHEGERIKLLLPSIFTHGIHVKHGVKNGSSYREQNRKWKALQRNCREPELLPLTRAALWLQKKPLRPWMAKVRIYYMSLRMVFFFP